MKAAVDTNVFSARWSAEPRAGQMAPLRGASHNLGSVVNFGAVYPDLLAHPKASTAFVDEFLTQTNVAIEFELDEVIWCEAAKTYAAYVARRSRSHALSPNACWLMFGLVLML